MAMEWGAAMNAAVNAVNTRMQDLNLKAATFEGSLRSALSALGATRMMDVPAASPMGSVPNAPPDARLAQAPTLGSASSRSPTQPNRPSTSLIVTEADLGDMPTTPEIPDISLEDAPAMGALAAPVRPTIDTKIALPTKPVFDDVRMGALHTITVPSFTFPQLPTFDHKPPSTDHLTVPDVFINWSEPQYQSEVLPDLLEWVKRYMAGGTGLPAPVEDALFGRARERDSAEAQRALQEATDTWAARGFTMPPGMLARQAAVVREQSRLKAAELNRDILVEASKWEIENIRFAVQQGIALEQLLENLHENLAKRLFEVAKFQAEAQISVFNAQVGLFNAQNAAFQTLATVYKAKLDGELAKVQAWKTQIEGLQLVGQLNTQTVEVFKARVGALATQAELYATQMKAAQVQADMVKTQIEGWRTDVQAFAEQVSVEKLKVDAYEAQMRGEQARASVYDARARTYASTVQGLAAKADVKIKNNQLHIEKLRADTQVYMADVERYKADIEDHLRQSQHQVAQFQAQVEAWKAGAQIEVANSEVRSRYTDLQTRTNIAFAEMQIKNFEAKSTHAYHQAQIAVEASKAVGQYTAQLAAGALSALHVSASVQGSGSHTATSTSTESTNTNHNYHY